MSSPIYDDLLVETFRAQLDELLLDRGDVARGESS